MKHSGTTSASTTWRARIRSATAFAALLAAFQLLTAGAAQAWWKSDWTYRMRIVADTTDKGANISGKIGRAHILLRLHSGNFDFGKAKDDGADLRLVAGDDRTPLHFDIEKYDGLVDQVALIWVDLPDVAASGQTPFYLYWGNKNAAMGSDPHGTYGPDQVLVYHFANESGAPVDSTAFGNNGLTPVKRDRSALIGIGARFAGTDPVPLPKSPSLAMPASANATWSLWIKPADGAPRTAVLFSETDGANSLTIGLDQGVAYAQVAGPDGTRRTTPGAAIPAQGWHQIAVVADDHLTVYVDGVAQGNVAGSLPALAGQGFLDGSAPAPAAAAAPAAPGTPPLPAPASSGAPAPAASGAPAAASPGGDVPAAGGLVGDIDEFEILKAPTTVGALQAEVSSEGTDPKLLTFDVAEESSFFGSGYVGIILRSVGLDSWVVIGILGVMALLSWWVMAGKAVYLSRLARANAGFRAEYARMLGSPEIHTEANPDGLAGDNRAALLGLSPTLERKLEGASLYRLYRIGSDELFIRLGGGLVEAGGLLRPQSIAAIRAAIDAGLVRETIRLNRLMVLLTISIAGGPFLGLLGTVVGVMITFAAIAQAGDVNVNAIAPGISAALLATVAGLFVAIPALFGYNYLLTRIRDASAEMNAFVDELVTRMGEGLHPAQRRRAPNPAQREI